MNVVVASIFAYVALQMLVGVYVSRQIQNEDDYLLAGRSLGPVLATFSIFATWFGAETCIGAAGAVYERGLSGTRGDPFGYTIVIIVLAALFAVPLWRAQITTLGDLFRRRFSPRVEQVAVVLMIPTSILWAGAQIRAFGQVLASASDGISASIGIALAAGTVLVYTTFGGMLADAWTDLIQGIVLAIGLTVVTIMVASSLGGPAAALANVGPAHWALTAPGETTIEVLNRWAVPILGSITAQELVGRIVACRTAAVARRAAWTAAFVYLSVGLMPVALGLMATQVPLGVVDAEHVLPELAQHHLPRIGYVLFVGALVSAILSTVNSCLLVAGALLSHNLVVPHLPSLSEIGRLRAARIAVLFSGAVAWYLALASESVLTLVEEASGFGSAGILVLMIFGLWSRFGGPSSAMAALLSGVAVWIPGHYIYALPYDYLASVGAALGAYLIVGALEHRSTGALEVRSTGA
jgi:Na+/proline symporter